MNNIEMDNIDKKIIIEVSGDLSIDKDFYNNISKSVGISLKELLIRLNNLQKKGILKRVAPVIKHRNTEYLFNGLATFSVKGELKENLLKKLKDAENISHVYERKPDYRWPYTVYGMTHGKSKEEVEDTIKNIAEELAIDEYKILYSLREFKKTSPDMEYLLKKTDINILSG
jgi:siroheme decarboxylase